MNTKTKMTVAVLLCAMWATALFAQQINSVEFKGKVDLIDIKVQPGKVWVECLNNEYPGRMYINGRTYTPKWNGRVGSPFDKITGEWKPFEGCVVGIRTKRGRSPVEVVEQPTAANGWTATIRIVDHPADDGEYSIEIRW